MMRSIIELMRAMIEEEEGLSSHIKEFRPDAMMEDHIWKEREEFSSHDKEYRAIG